MHTRNCLAALALLALLATLTAASASSAPAPRATQPDDLRALGGVWIYVEDRTEGRPVEDHQPSMSDRVTFRVEEDAVVLIRSNGEIRMPLDGSPTEIRSPQSASRYSGQWKDGAFEYMSDPIRPPGETSGATIIRWTLRPTDEGLLASVSTDSGWHSVALYRHPDDIPLPTPAEATIDDLAWLEGAWVGTRGEGGAISIEERWTPPLGGAMLGVSRTVRGGSMRAFEFLRIMQRETGLVYIAQPNGGTATTFTLTELTETRAVFENPRHDSPQRITYEVSPEGRLTASIGYINGGLPRQFEYTREQSPVAPD